MKLKVKCFDWLAGKPVVVLNDKTAKKMNVFVDDRIEVISKGKKVYSVIDIFPKLVKSSEAGVSNELAKVLGLKNGSWIEVNSSEMSEASFLIKKKIAGEILSGKELEKLVAEIVNNNLTSAEIAFFTAAQKLNGMNDRETVDLTKAMVKTGAKLKFNGKYIADKHCIGGIAGNRTTPIVVSICACLGLTIPKTSSRAITSASGTADVIETISNVELPLKKIKDVVNKTGACLAWGGSLGLAPSDDKIIQVERLLGLDIEPQLLASIMSKKLSAGSKYILIDIPYGKGGKMSTLVKAKGLGKKFEMMGRAFKVKVKVVYTDGTQPVGNGYGPVLEMKDVISVLQNKGPKDLEKKSLFLANELVKLCGIRNSEKKVFDVLKSGAAYEKFKEIINEQNGENNFDERVLDLKLAKFKKNIRASRSGKISSISNHGINSLCRILGTPETISSGVYLYKHLENVKKGEVLLTMYSESKSKIKDAMKFYKSFKPIKF